ncbi:MAG TPA: hypothetical protein VIU13_05400, partial [Chryseolinea sp.]
MSRGSIGHNVHVIPFECTLLASPVTMYTNPDQVCTNNKGGYREGYLKYKKKSKVTSVITLL